MLGLVGFGLFWGHRSLQRAGSLRPQPQGSPPLGFCSPPGGSQGSPTPQEAVWGRWGPVGAFPPQRGRRAGEANKGSLVYTKITEMFYSKKKKKEKKNEKISFTKERTQHGSCRTHTNPQAARGTRARHLHACQGRILFRSTASSSLSSFPSRPQIFSRRLLPPLSSPGLLLETSAPSHTLQGFPSAPRGALPVPKGALEKPWGEFWLLSPPRPYLQGHKSFLKLFLSHFSLLSSPPSFFL